MMFRLKYPNWWLCIFVNILTLSDVSFEIHQRKEEKYVCLLNNNEISDPSCKSKQEIEKHNYAKIAYTDDYDWEIRNLLDEALEYIGPEPEEALKLIENILKLYPESNRARYYHIITKQALALTKEQNDMIATDFYEILVESISKDVKLPLYQSIIASGINHNINHNLTQRLIEFLQVLVRNVNATRVERYHLLFAQYLFLDRQLSRAEEALQAAIKSFPNNPILLILLIVTLKLQDRKKEANQVLRQFMMKDHHEENPRTGEELSNNRIIINMIGISLYKRARPDEALLVFNEASKHHIFPSVYQRPLEYLINLETHPIWELEYVSISTHHDDFALLKTESKTILDEALASLSKDENQNNELWINPKNSILRNKTQWQEFILYDYGKRRNAHCAVTPRTCGILKTWRKAAKGCITGSSKFIAMFPGARTWPYTGPTNGRLRLLMKLQGGPDVEMRIANESVVKWQNQLVIIDDSFQHEFWNKDNLQIFLSVDFDHPDLSNTQQKQRFTTLGKEAFRYM